MGCCHNSLGGKGKRAAVGVVCKDIAGVCIGKKRCHGACPARTIPCAAGDTLRQDHWPLLGLGCQGNKVLVAFLDLRKEAVGLTLLAYEQTIKPHPLGSCQGVWFHIFDTLYNRRLQAFEHAERTVLIGRHEKGLRVKNSHLLQRRCHAATTTGYGALCDELLQLRYVYILSIAHALYDRWGLEPKHELAQRSCGHNSTVDRKIHDIGTDGEVSHHLC